MTNRSKGAQNYIESVSKVYQNEIKTTPLMNARSLTPITNYRRLQKSRRSKHPTFDHEKKFSRAPSIQLRRNFKPRNKLQHNSQKQNRSKPPSGPELVEGRQAPVAWPSCPCVKRRTDQWSVLQRAREVRATQNPPARLCCPKIRGNFGQQRQTPTEITCHSPLD